MRLKLNQTRPLYLLAIFALAPWTGARAADEELLFAEIPTVYAASRREQPVAEAPASVTIITSEDIHQYGYRTLAQALASVPGFYLTDDRGYTTIGVRGMGVPGDLNIRLLFLLNGLPLNDKYYGTFVPELTPDMFDAIERIEVVKGPSSALYGSDGLFATINIITRTGAAAGGHATVSGEVGSDPSGRGVFSYGKLFNNGLDLFFSGYDDADHGESTINFGRFGSAHNADEGQIANAYLSAKYDDFSAQFWYGDRRQDIPTGQYGTIVGDNHTHVEDAWYVAEVRWQHSFGDDKTLMLRTYYEDYPYEGTYVYSDPTNTVNREQTLDRWLGYEAQFNWRPFEYNEITAGAVFEYHWTQLSGNYRDSAGQISSVYTGTQDDFPYWAIYLQDELHILTNLCLTAGVRYDDYPDSNVWRTSPRAALVWNATSQTTVKLLYGQAFRAPSNFERTYPYGADLGPLNTSLKPETITTYEFVVEQDFRHGLFGRLSVFYNDVQRVIAPVSETPLIYANLYDVETPGVEAELTKKFANGVRGFVNATWQDSMSDKGQLVNSPEWLANLGLNVPVLGEKLSVSLRENFVSSRAMRVPGESTDNAFLTDLTLNSENPWPHWSFNFTVQNLFNQHNQVPTSPNGTPDTLPQPGLVLLLRASYRF